MIRIVDKVATPTYLQVLEVVTKIFSEVKLRMRKSVFYTPRWEHKLFARQDDQVSGVNFSRLCFCAQFYSNNYVFSSRWSLADVFQMKKTPYKTFTIATKCHTFLHLPKLYVPKLYPFCLQFYIVFNCRSKIELGDVTPHNIKQLKLLNQVVFPVSYNEKFYKDVLEAGELAKLAYYNDIVVFKMIIII